MAEEQPGFLSRWARRKTDVLHGKPLDEPVAAPVNKLPVAASPASLAPASTEPEAATASQSPAPAPEKLLSLDDVKLLTQESDFRPFMARNVGPDVRNAAMKKLFTDPHYNVMDGLDIYIDDYSIADPIPESMLRQMVGAKLLNIFDEPEEQEKLEKPEKQAGQGLESPAAVAEQASASAVSSSGTTPDAVDSGIQAPSVLLTDEIPMPAIPPEPGAGDAQALLTPQAAEQQNILPAGPVDTGAKYNPGA